MNKIHSVVWSTARNMYVVASEFSRSGYGIKVIAATALILSGGNISVAKDIQEKVTCSSSGCKPIIQDGDTVTANNGDAIYMNTGSHLELSDVMVSTSVDGSWVSGSVIDSNGGILTLSDSVINAMYSDDIDILNSSAISLDRDATATLNSVDVNVDIWTGADNQVTLSGDSLAGIDITTSSPDTLALEAADTDITINDDYGYYWVGNKGYSTVSATGIMLREGTVKYHGGSITVNGDKGKGIWINPWLGDGRNQGLSTLYIDGGTKINVTGWGAQGIYQVDGNDVYVGDVATGMLGADIVVQGESSAAFVSASTDMTNVFSFANSTLTALSNPDNPQYMTAGIMLAGGGYYGVLDNTAVVADDALRVKDYYYCSYEGQYQNFYTDNVNLSVTNGASLTGNIRVDDLDINAGDTRPVSTTTLNLDFSRHASLNGAVNAYDADGDVMADSSTTINLSFDDSSLWVIADDSRIDRLDNNGKLIFTSVNKGGNYSTLHTG